MSVKDNISFIQELFLSSKETVIQSSSFEELETAFNCQDGPFVSVSFESAASVFATESKEKWAQFTKRNIDKHGSQLHVGLGWAIAENNLNISSFLDELDDVWKFRVLDGVGYYSGLFKRREAIRQQLWPSSLIKTDFPAFDQGLGRSLWYLSKGELDRLEQLVSLFNADRQKNLWRGVGLAATYVGGLSADDALKLLSLSGKNESALKVGSLLALAACEKAEVLTADRKTIGTALNTYKPELFKSVFEIKNNYLNSLLDLEGVFT